MPYTYHRSLTIDHTLCGTADSSDFPVLVYISDATFKTVANGGHVENSSGFDIGFFTDVAAAFPLSWEIDSYDGVNGILWAWVKIPTLTHATDVVLYVHYGDSGITTLQSVASSVWSTSVYQQVYHLSESGQVYHDSGPVGANSYTTQISPPHLSGNDPTQVAGKIGKGQQFTAAGTSQIIVPKIRRATANGAFSGWIKTTTASPVAVVDGRGNGIAQGGVLYLNLGQANFYRNNSGPIISAATFNDGAWHHLVSVSTGSVFLMELYVDGVAVAGANISTGLVDETGDMFIGRAFDGAFADCYLDEVREYVGGLTPNRILQEYNAQNDPATFVSVGVEAFATLTGSITATASPQAAFIPSTLAGIFTVSAFPRAFFVPGLIQLTAAPQAQFTALNNVYTAMGFTGAADPLASFEVEQPSGFAMEGSPLLKWFPPVGQSGACISGSGAPSQSKVGNAVY